MNQPEDGKNIFIVDPGHGEDQCPLSLLFSSDVKDIKFVVRQIFKHRGSNNCGDTGAVRRLSPY